MRSFILALLVLCGFSSLARADYAFVFTKTLCDNQADSMDAAWAASRFAGWGTQKLFFFDGANFQPVGHADAFDGFARVVIAAHGTVGRIADKSGARFAGIFQAHHPSTPTDVFLMVCSSAAQPHGGRSVVGELAARYPGAVVPAQTAIAHLTGATAACRLTGAVGVPVVGIGDATYRESVASSAEGDRIARQLVKDWKSTIYPPSNFTYARFCRKNHDADAYAPFIAQVQAAFMVPYLNLIRQNGVGNALYECGSATGTPICQ